MHKVIHLPETICVFFVTQTEKTGCDGRPGVSNFGLAVYCVGVGARRQRRCWSRRPEAALGGQRHPRAAADKSPAAAATDRGCAGPTSGIRSIRFMADGPYEQTRQLIAARWSCIPYRPSVGSSTLSSVRARNILHR